MPRWTFIMLIKVTSRSFPVQLLISPWGYRMLSGYLLKVCRDYTVVSFFWSIIISPDITHDHDLASFLCLVMIFFIPLLFMDWNIPAEFFSCMSEKILSIQMSSICSTNRWYLTNKEDILVYLNSPCQWFRKNNRETNPLLAFTTYIHPPIHRSMPCSVRSAKLSGRLRFLCIHMLSTGHKVLPASCSLLCFPSSLSPFSVSHSSGKTSDRCGRRRGRWQE